MTAIATSTVTHIAGAPISVGPRVRQRCAWCGAVLLDYDLEHMQVAVPEGMTEEQARAQVGAATWPAGLVRCGDGFAYSIDLVEGEVLPDDCCGKLDPEVTR